MHPTVKAARIAGFIYLSMIIVAPFCLLYIPSKLIVHGNAAATAENIIVSRRGLERTVIASSSISGLRNRN